MAAALLLSGQPFIALYDDIEHAHHHAHVPNALAGDVEQCFVGHHDCDTSGDNSGMPLAHHHGDAGFMFVLADAITVITPVDRSEASADATFLLSGISARRPDHPPKGASHIRTI